MELAPRGPWNSITGTATQEMKNRMTMSHERIFRSYKGLRGLKTLACIENGTVSTDWEAFEGR